jgi:hypothetical protein
LRWLSCLPIIGRQLRPIAGKIAAAVAARESRLPTKQ